MRSASIAARLVRDGGTLQIGIGEEGDAAVQALIMRHRDNVTFRDAVARLTPGMPMLAIDQTAPFSEGLYGVSEMFVDGSSNFSMPEFSNAKRMARCCTPLSSSARNPFIAVCARWTRRFSRSCR